jgi:hypothetical protein
MEPEAGGLLKHRVGYWQQPTSNINSSIKKEPSYTAGGNVNQYNHSGKKFRGYLKS